MEEIYRKFADSLLEAEKKWHNSDYLLSVTYKVVKDEKLLLRVLENINKTLVLLISIILKFEYLHKRIELSNDIKKNLDVFFRKSAVRYGLDENNIDVLKKIIFLNKKHVESGLEFSKRGKVFMLDDDMHSFFLDEEFMKSSLNAVKLLLDSANKIFSSYSRKV